MHKTRPPKGFNPVCEVCSVYVILVKACRQLAAVGSNPCHSRARSGPPSTLPGCVLLCFDPLRIESKSHASKVFIGFLEPSDSEVTLPNQTMPNQTMPNHTPADNVPQHIAVIMLGNRRFGGASVTGLTGLSGLPARR